MIRTLNCSLSKILAIIKMILIITITTIIIIVIIIKRIILIITKTITKNSEADQRPPQQPIPSSWLHYTTIESH